MPDPASSACGFRHRFRPVTPSRPTPLAVFVGGIVLGILVVVTMAIKREDKGKH